MRSQSLAHKRLWAVVSTNIEAGLDLDSTGFVDPDPGEHILKMKKMKISYFEVLALRSILDCWSQKPES